MAGEGSPTPFEIPCGLLHGILHDVRSGIEGYGGGVQVAAPSARSSPGQGYILIRNSDWGLGGLGFGFGCHEGIIIRLGLGSGFG